MREKRSDLGNWLGEVLYECEKRGMQMPFLIVGVGINGSVTVLRHSLDDDSDEMEVIVEPTGEFMLPLNIMIVDAKGEAARAAVFKDGKTVVH